MLLYDAAPRMTCCIVIVILCMWQVEKSWICLTQVCVYWQFVQNSGCCQFPECCYCQMQSKGKTFKIVRVAATSLIIFTARSTQFSSNHRNPGVSFSFFFFYFPLYVIKWHPRGSGICWGIIGSTNSCVTVVNDYMRRAASNQIPRWHKTTYVQEITQ